MELRAPIPMELRVPMELFESKQYDESITQLENKLKRSFDEDEQIFILQGIGACQYTLELYRRAVKTCLDIIGRDKDNVRRLMIIIYNISICIL
jgi:hypothetical protein